MQSLKIDLLKFTGARAFTSKDGTDFVAIPIKANGVFVSPKGPHYLELTLIENKNGPSEYGDIGFAAVNLSREQREAGERGPIVGNFKNVGTRAAAPAPAADAIDDDIVF